MANSLKKRSDKAQVYLFAFSMCQNQVVSDNCCGTPFFAGTAITLLQIFDLVFTGSRVATTFVMSHTYCIYWELFIYPQLHRHLNEGCHTQLG